MASTVRLDAEAVASATFAAARRGYDPEEVRTYLRALSAHVRQLEGEVTDLRAQLAHRSTPALDEAAVAAALGEEAARLLTTAREAASDIRARAQEQADEVGRVAHDDADRVRRDADLDAAQRRTDADNEASALLETAKGEGREMLAEARAVRERMLDDLARRRERGREQLAALRASHERVLRALEMASASLSIAATDVRDLGPDVGATTADDWSSDSGSVPIVPGLADSGAPLSSAVEVPTTGEPLTDSAPDAPVTPDAPVASSAPVAAVVSPPSAIEVVVPVRTASEPSLTLVPDERVVDEHGPDSEGSSLDQTYLRTFSLGELASDSDSDAAAAGAPRSPGGDDMSHRPMPSADDVFARIRAARASLRSSTDGSPSSTSAESDTVTSAAKFGAVGVLDDVNVATDAETSVRRRVEPVERLLAAGPVTSTATGKEPIEDAPIEDAPIEGTAIDERRDVNADPLRPAPSALANDVLAARNAALVPVAASLARRLKRVLADEQNDVLDRLRRAKSRATVDEMFGPVAEHAALYRRAIDDDLWDAAVAGALSLRPELASDGVDEAVDRAGVLTAVGQALIADVIVPLRQRLARCLSDGDSAVHGESALHGDSAAAGDLARAAYREWKTQRIDELAGQLSLHAFGQGAFAALAPGTSVCWAVDPNAPPCPDGDDNVLAGVVTAGSPFPTGHLSAPAYAGCRCMLVRP